jgi:hypothetical protein
MQAGAQNEMAFEERACADENIENFLLAGVHAVDGAALPAKNKINFDFRRRRFAAANALEYGAMVSTVASTMVCSKMRSLVSAGIGSITRVNLAVWRDSRSVHGPNAAAMCCCEMPFVSKERLSASW